MSRHRTIIDIIKSMGYKTTEGVCHGLSSMAMQAFLVNDFSSFENRLLELGEKGSDKTILALNNPDNQLSKLDVEKKLWFNAFFDGVTIYQNPIFYEGFFNGTQDLSQSELPGLPIVKPAHQNEPVALKSHSIAGSANKLDLKHYFQLLTDQLSVPTSFIMGSLGHAINLNFDPNNKQWIYFDANEPPAKQFKTTELERLVANVFKGFQGNQADKQSHVLVFQIGIYISNQNKKTAQASFDELEQLKAWKTVHQPAYVNAIKADASGSNWFCSADQLNKNKQIQALVDGMAPNEKAKACFPDQNGASILSINAGKIQYRTLCRLFKRMSHQQKVQSLMIDKNSPSQLLKQGLNGHRASARLATHIASSLRAKKPLFENDPLKIADNPLYQLNDKGQNLVSVAAERGWADACLNKLVQLSNEKKGSSQVTYQIFHPFDDDNRTPLWLALNSNQTECIKLLLEQLEPQPLSEEQTMTIITTADSKRKQTPLQLAVTNGNIEILQSLLHAIKGQDHNKAAFASLNSALNSAVWMKQPQCAKIIIERIEEIEASLNLDSQRASERLNGLLWPSVSNDNSALAKYIIGRLNEAQIQKTLNHTDHQGRSLLWIAAYSTNSKDFMQMICRQLSPEQVNELLFKTDKQEALTPLEVAIEHNNFNCADILLKQMKEQQINQFVSERRNTDLGHYLRRLISYGRPACLSRLLKPLSRPQVNELLNQNDSEDSLLLTAIASGNHQCLQHMLESMPLDSITDIMANPDQQGKTLIGHAATQGQAACLQTLIDHLPASQRDQIINRPKRDGKTPLLAACLKNKPECVNVILQYMSRQQITDALTQKVSKEVNLLKKIVDDGHAPVLDTLIGHLSNAEKQVVFQTPVSEGKSVLLEAGETGDLECLETLIEHLPKEQKHTILNQRDKHNRTPFQLAYDCGHSQCAEMIFGNLDQQTQAETLALADSDGKTWLNKAIDNKDEHFFNSLVECIPQHEKLNHLTRADKEGKTLFWHAAAHGQAASFQKLINHIDPAQLPSIINRADQSGITPLEVACINGNARCATLILGRISEHEITKAVTQSANKRENLVHRTLDAGFEDCFRVLVSMLPRNQRLQVINKKDSKGQSSLCKLAANGHDEYLQAIINDLPSDELRVIHEQSDHPLTSPFWSACAQGNVNCARIIADAMDEQGKARLLTQLNNNGETALTMAQRLGHSELVRAFQPSKTGALERKQPLSVSYFNQSNHKNQSKETSNRYK